MLNLGLTWRYISVDAPLAGPSAHTQHNTMLDHTPKAYGYSLFKVKGTLLFQLLVASCVLHGVSATAVTPAASGLSSPSPTCGCSEEIAALQEEIGAMKVFMGMMPPSTPPSPPPSTPPSPPPP